MGGKLFRSVTVKYTSASVIFQRLQQEKEHLSSEGLMVPWLPQLRVITAQDGADSMIFNQLDITTAQSLMVTKSTSLAELEQSKFKFPEIERVSDQYFQIY